MEDYDIEGQVQVLLRVLISPEWHTLWHELGIRIESFTTPGMPTDISDAELRQVCQTRQIVLITGNRSQAAPDSLEAVIQPPIPPGVCPC
jgi:hypothetical protein